MSARPRRHPVAVETVNAMSVRRDDVMQLAPGSVGYTWHAKRRMWERGIAPGWRQVYAVDGDYDQSVYDKIDAPDERFNLLRVSDDDPSAPSDYPDMFIAVGIHELVHIQQDVPEEGS